MNYTIIKPSEILAPFIKYYWSLDCAISGEPEPYRIIPQGVVELMFFYKNRYQSIKINNRTDYLLPNTIVTGQQRSYFDLKATGDIGIFSICFKPHGAKMFFSFPINEFTDRSIALIDFAGKDAAVLEEKIIDAKNNQQRVRCIEEFLVNKFIEKEFDNFKRITAVISKIIETKGIVSIETLSRIACLGYKQFDREFVRYVGMTPKQYLKIVRFHNVLDTRYLSPKITLINLAIDCGYYDQAHFYNDFKKITGMTPKLYFASSEPFSDFFTH